MTSVLRASGRCVASAVMASCTRLGARLITTSSISHKMITTSSVSHKMITTSSVSHKMITTSSISHKMITTSSISHKMITSHFPSAEPSSTNLTSHILKDSSKWANHIATECGVTRRRYSFSQLVDRVARWAGMLTKLGIKKGDFVAIIMLNCPEYSIVMLGAISIGAIVTGVNPTYTPGEILRQLEDSGAKLVIGDTFSEKTIDAALALYKKRTVLVINGPSTVDGVLDLQHILEDSSLPFTDPIEVSGKDLALMPYSSGTTGKPKGVALSHSAVASNVTMNAHPSVFTSHETTGQRAATLQRVDSNLICKIS